MQFVDPAKQFAKDSLRLVKRCTKPDRKGEVGFRHTQQFGSGAEKCQLTWSSLVKLLALFLTEEGEKASWTSAPFLDLFLGQQATSWVQIGWLLVVGGVNNYCKEWG